MNASEKNNQTTGDTAVESSALLECCQCGATEQLLSEIKACGAPWKWVLACEICGIAASGNSVEEATQKFKDGNCELETAP